ncbi:hypothetical protein HPB48_002986 [Haemaphysalis longicornis]|uniref:Uncharacterized protein n=1 Tax=Haemaphysalis longicornis TaxID=44386 RepID=A0A9J6FGF2_HAELO|nr:hypothetical protein HPB48_002986 [Haemaphysalis longicornis]
MTMSVELQLHHAEQLSRGEEKSSTHGVHQLAPRASRVRTQENPDPPKREPRGITDRGAIGIDGPKGDTGEKGDKGEKGVKRSVKMPHGGIADATDFKGPPGELGPSGPPGLVGEKGDKGERGLTTTLDGNTFPTGFIEGPAGPPGPPGSAGPPGRKGEDEKRGRAGECMRRCEGPSSERAWGRRRNDAVERLEITVHCALNKLHIHGDNDYGDKGDYDDTRTTL